MPQEKKFLHHCERCGELFYSKKCSINELHCNVCGQYPLKSNFSTLSERRHQKKRIRRNYHGVAGKDQADINSMKKARFRKLWIRTIGIWLLALCGMAVLTYRTYNKAKAKRAVTVDLSAEDRAYLVARNKAIESCVRTFRFFTTETNVNAKTSYALNGSDLILEMNRYYDLLTVKNDRKNLSKAELMKADFIEDATHPQLITLYRFLPDKNSPQDTHEFEVIFWKVGDKWLIDWEHYVRLSEEDWFIFIEKKALNKPKKFRLYAKKYQSKSMKAEGYSEFKFSLALNDSTQANIQAESVLIKQTNILKKQLNNLFLAQKKRDQDNLKRNKIIGSFDPYEHLRLEVTLDYQEINGKKELILVQIHDTDWQTTPREDN